LLFLVAAAGVTGRAQTRTPDYTREVQPILAENCYRCHGANERKGGLRLDNREGAKQTLARGPDGSSELVRRISSKDPGIRMPPWPTAVSLNPAEVETLTKWSGAGAPWAEAAADAAAVPLFKAIDGGDTSAARVLAADRALVGTRDTHGATPLMHAVLHADLDCVKFLLKQGADPNAQNHSGATALIWSVDDAAKAAALLKAGAKPNLRSNHGTSALIAASQIAGNRRVIAQLLAKGADVNAADSDGSTPLIKASAAGDAATVRLLISHGAKVNSEINTFTPLTAAAWYGHTDIVRVLLDNGADVNAKDAYLRMTPLGAAALFEREEIARMLIDKGADVNLDMQASYGMTPGTPLMIAAYTESLRPELTRLLLARGAKAGYTTPEGHTAVTRAREKGDTEVVRTLRASWDPEPAHPAPAGVPGSAKELPDLHAAVERSLALLQKSDGRFFDLTGCKSCHNQALPAMAYGMARERGFRFDEAAARKQSDNMLAIMTAQREKVLELMDDEGPALSGGYAVAAMAAMGYPADATLAAFARGMAIRQLPAGNWHVGSNRPPMEYSPVSATAFAIQTLALYGPRSRDADYRARIERAKTWLSAQRPSSNEERVFQLLGLGWSKAEAGILRKLSQDLIVAQREDGGWAQLSTLPSDAYATGEALYALHIAGGIAANSPEYTRGVEFLRRTQLEDGSWLVKSRAVAIQPPLDSGFPHGRDQFISAAGTSWAAMALMLTEAPRRAPPTASAAHR
jgi:ankyrin repeat protein